MLPARLPCPAFTHAPARGRWPGLAVIAALAAACLPVQAQYKVVQPDGSVTYTDRPPADGRARVTPMAGAPGAAAAAARGDAGFPPDLRLAAQRYPVTLFTTADCTPCETGRQWLARRGVPYTERRIVTQEDDEALQRQVGGRTVPSLTVGAQPVRGFSETDWAAYLDAAGYPRENRLPRGWQPPPATPLVSTPPRSAVEPQPAPARAAAPTAPPTPPAGPGGFRF